MLVEIWKKKKLNATASLVSWWRSYKLSFQTPTSLYLHSRDFFFFYVSPQASLRTIFWIMPKYLSGSNKSLFAWFHKVNQTDPLWFHHWIINQVKNNWSALDMSATYWSTHWALVKYNEDDESPHCIRKWANKEPCEALFPLSFLNIAFIL